MGTVPSHPWIKLSCPKKYKKPVISFEITGFRGACGRTRTGDLRITNALLYQLSHASNFTKLTTLSYVSLDSIARFYHRVNLFFKFSLTFSPCSI